MKKALNQIVNGKKGKGVITRIITASTGYVEVTYSNGSVVKEMAFNLTYENGTPVKNKRVVKERTESQKIKDQRAHANFKADMNMAILQDNFLDSQIKSGNYNTDLIR